MIVTDVRAPAELTDEANAVSLLVRTALADLAVDGDTSKLTVGTAVATLTTLSLDHAVVLELGRNGAGLEITTTVVDRAGASPVASVVAGDGDVIGLAAGVVKQVVAVTHATAKPVPEISFGQLRPYAEAMRLSHDDPAGAIAVLDDADPATASAVGAIHHAIGGLATAQTTPAGRLAVARALGAAPDPADIRTILTGALAAQPPNDAKLNQLLTEALANDGQRRVALAFASSIDHARLTAATQRVLLELAQRAVTTNASSAAITSHVGLGVALANIDVDGGLALVEPRELGPAELDTVEKLLAGHASVPKATAARLRAELAMRRHDPAEAAAIDAYLAAAPMDPRARLYKQLATQPAAGSGRPAKPAAAAQPSNDRREPVLVVIGALLGMGVVLVVLLVLMSFRKPRADKQVPVAPPVPAPRPGMVSVRIVIAAEVRQGIAIWTTDRRNSAYTDAAGEATLELAPGDHLLNFESNGEAVTLSVGIGVEPVQRLELELLRAGGSAPAKEPPVPPPVAPPERVHPALAVTESPVPMLAPSRDSHPAFEDTAQAAPALLAAIDGIKLENGAEEHRHVPKKAGTFGVAPPPTLSGYAPPPAVPTAIVEHLVPPPLKPVEPAPRQAPERPTPMPPVAKPVEQKPEPAPEAVVAAKPVAAPVPKPVEPTPKPMPKPITTLPAPKAVDPSPKGLTKPASVVTKPAPIVSKVPAIPPIAEAKPQDPVSKIVLLPLDGGAAPEKAMDMELGAAGATVAPAALPPAASFVLEHTSEASSITSPAAKRLETSTTTPEAKRLETTGVHLETTKIAEIPAAPATIPENVDAIPPLDTTDTQVRRMPTDVAGVSSEISAIIAAPPTLVENAVAEPPPDAEPEERAEPTTVTPMDIPGEPTLVTPEEKSSTEERAKVEVTIVGPPVAPIVPKPQKVPIYQKRSPVPEPTGPLRLGNRYEVQDEAARPVPGTIVRGFDERLKRHVGIEAYPVLDPIATAKHVGSIAKLEHANLVRVYELIVEEGRPYLITEPLTGKSLDAHIAERGIYPWVEAVALMDSVCAGLEYAHDRSILHRAIRPSVIVLQVTTAKLGGFAIEPDRTAVGYVAPEVMGGSRPERSTDIYAIGATLFHALTGKSPPVDEKPTIEVPRKLQILLEAMLAKTPAGRPSSIQAVRASFKSLLDF